MLKNRIRANMLKKKRKILKINKKRTVSCPHSSRQLFVGKVRYNFVFFYRFDPAKSKAFELCNYVLYV